jgi:hypothetical protein
MAEHPAAPRMSLLSKNLRIAAAKANAIAAAVQELCTLMYQTR